MEPDRATGARTSEAFRPDIEGLRGVAVLLVLLFHGSLVAMPGGFIGVDVFFVISGFLITGLLFRERERSGGIRLQAFYARRVRRLLPAGMVALIVTLILSSVLLDPLDRASAALDGVAAALSVGNIRFAMAAGDYFASVESPSPFLHFWSLAVEEQFYLVWPVLILIATAWRRPRLGAGLALGVVLAGSLAANLAVTDVAVNWAFYSLPTRAWQLALGGIIAVGLPVLKGMPGGPLAIVGWCGAIALAWAALTYDGMLAYPGIWAVVPTFAAAAIIVSGTARHGPGFVLSTGPLRFFGRISYSLYLWHWPILVLPVAALEQDLPMTGRVALAGVAVLAAWLSWRLIEEPFRTGFPSLARHPARTVIGGATAVAIVVSIAGGFAAAESPASWPTSETITEVVLDELDGPATDWDDVVNETPWPSLDASVAAVPPPTVSAAPATSSPVPSTAPNPTPTPRTYVRLPSDVRPSLARARTDEERLRDDRCLAFEGVTVPPDCVYGDRKGSITVALVGDSHAAQWFPAIERVARQRGWRLLTYVKVACPFLDMRVRNLSLKREYHECEAFNNATIARLRDTRPDLTLVSMSRFAIHPVLERDNTVAAQGVAYARMLERIPGRVAVIVDTPDGGRDVPACLSRHVADVRECAVTRRAAFARELGAIEEVATTATGATLVDLTSRVCRGDPCPVVVDGMIVFRDMRHLTATFSRSLAPELDRELGTILATPTR